MIKLSKSVTKLFKKIVDDVRFRRLKKKCNHLHKIDGKQYFIVPVANNGRYSMTIMNRHLHDAYNRKARKMNIPQMSYMDLLRIAMYKTPTGKLVR